MSSTGVSSDDAGNGNDQIQHLMAPNVPPVPHPGMEPFYPQMAVPSGKLVPTDGLATKEQVAPPPKGSWASGVKKGQDRYFYLKTDEYLNDLRIAERRVTIQLAYLYLINTKRAVADFVNSLHENEIILITHSDTSESVVRLILTVNVIKHSSYDIHSIENIHLLPKQQVLILGDMNFQIKPKHQVLQKLRDFVEQGGLLLSFNTAIVLLDEIFPNKFQYLRGYKTVEKPIRVRLDIEPGDEEDTFGRYATKNRENEFLVLRQGVQRFSVIDPSVRVLLTEIAPRKNQPLVTKFHHGKGTVYHLLISHLASKVGDQGGTSFQGLSEMLDLPSKELAIETIKNLEKMDPPPFMTITAWKNALNCGYPSSINAAKALTITLDVFFSLLQKSLRPSSS